MSVYDRWLLKIKRAETPLSRLLRRAILTILGSSPPVPSFLRPFARAAYDGFYLGVIAWRAFWSYFLWQPLFISRCARVGKRLRLAALPYVSGHVQIEIGDDVEFTGSVSILSGHLLDRPRLVIGDRAGVGGGTLISVSREVSIGADVRIAPNCSISDNDGHPKAADLRAQNARLTPGDIRPVRICRLAWIGRGCHIMKGVTIGEGAIIGANSTVISDVPPYSLAMGNPAEVYFRNVGRPAAQRTSAAPQE
ncbi:MAG: hypothetical protein ACE141_13395 [Bryobacteraceae bacterium]